VRNVGSEARRAVVSDNGRPAAASLPQTGASRKPVTTPLDKARLLARRTLFAGSFLTLTSEHVELPDGRPAVLELVRHPGASAVVPLAADGQVLLVRQYRHATDGWLLEVPAGKLDPGEAPAACARRELAEETGFAAGRLASLGSIFPSPGFTDEVIHLFLARDLTPAAQRLEGDELLSVEPVAFERAVAMAAGGAIADGKSVCALLRAARFLERQRPERS
jgi:ADP-ribose pyrophosphatase